MTVRELLEYVDSTRPNNIGDFLKTRWISEVEGRVLCEICKKEPDSIGDIVGEDDILSVPEAYSRLYTLYVISMIEFAEGNYSAHTSVSHQFEKAFTEYGKYFLRNKS